jgi:GNAT superfamily N-acetyltransferase
MAAGSVPPGVALRSARDEDARPIAEVHVASWRAAYAGLLPDAVLAGLSVEARAARWARLLADDRHQVVVAESEGEVIGFGHVGPSREADLEATTGQLITLYVEPGWWGTGVGRAVHDAALERLSRQDVDRVVLWVLSTNVAARRFYRYLGWERDVVLRVQQFGGAVVIDLRLSRAVRPG